MVNATYEALLLEAAMNPPPGMTSDFVNTGANHGLGIGIVIGTSIVAGISVAARLISSTIAKKFEIEDLLMVVALGILGGNQYTCWNLSSRVGFWVHMWNVQNRELIFYLEGIHIAAVYYGPIALLIKVAILVNWLRIFVPRGVRNALYWTLHALIWTNVVFYTITTFTEVFRCWPREKIWNPWYEGGRCTVDVLPQNIVTGLLNFISDTIILAIPQWMIWRLKMSSKQKIGISLLFVVGIGAWAMGVVRLVYFVKLLNDEDVTYQMSGVALWTLLEVGTGFLIMGIPAFPRVIKAIPVPESVSKSFRSWSGYVGRSMSSTPNKFQKMYKPKSRRRRSVFEIESALNTHNLISTRGSDDTGMDTVGSSTLGSEGGQAEKGNAQVSNVEPV